MRRILGATIVAALTTGCHQTKSYEAEVEVTRSSVVRRDEAGRPTTIDVEVSYIQCPGTQIEVVRGGPEFAACVAKYPVGAKVKVSIEHAWRREGYYKSTVRKMGECERVPDPDDEGSFAMIRECEDWKVNGANVGFQCRYVPEKKLVDQCPWFRRR